MRIIVGLGNPGPEYKQTRHNAGWLALDRWAEQEGLSWQTKKKWQAEVAEGSDFLLVKPQTFMNLSGQSIRSVLDFYGLLPKQFGLLTKKASNLSESLWLVHDELDIELGKWKLSRDSGAAGHNGVRSAIEHLKTKDFNRLRLGIKTDLRQHMPADKFVLARFSSDELKLLYQCIDEARKCLGA